MFKPLFHFMVKPNSFQFHSKTFKEVRLNINLIKFNFKEAEYDIYSLFIKKIKKYINLIFLKNRQNKN